MIISTANDDRYRSGAFALFSTANGTMLNALPNILTLSRIAVIPVLVGAFWLPGALADWVPFALYAAACFTDWLDGYLARRFGQMSELGRFLDPVADKLLVAASILMVVAFDRIDNWSILAAVVILCREIMVAGLREFLAELRVTVPVTRLAKWKTGVQMLAIGFLLLHDSAPGWLNAPLVGEVGLWVAAILTLYTGYDYFLAALQHFEPNSAAQHQARERRLDAGKSVAAEKPGATK